MVLGMWIVYDSSNTAKYTFMVGATTRRSFTKTGNGDLRASLEKNYPATTSMQSRQRKENNATTLCRIRKAIVQDLRAGTGNTMDTFVIASISKKVSSMHPHFEEHRRVFRKFRLPSEV